MVPPLFSASSHCQTHQAAHTALANITYATTSQSTYIILLLIYAFGVQLQDVFTISSFMRLSPAGNSLYGCRDCYLFFSKPFTMSHLLAMLTDLPGFVKWGRGFSKKTPSPLGFTLSLFQFTLSPIAFIHNSATISAPILVKCIPSTVTAL